MAQIAVFVLFFVVAPVARGCVVSDTDEGLAGSTADTYTTSTTDAAVTSCTSVTASTSTSSSTAKTTTTTTGEPIHARTSNKLSQKD